MNKNFSQSTIDNIYLQLGNLDEQVEGDIRSGIVQGQTREPFEGAEFYKSRLIEYKAIVVKKNDKLEWELLEMKPVA